MGDDELNFTDDEARCWADDPRNQPRKEHALLHVLVLSFLLLSALVMLGLLGAQHNSPPDTQGQIGSVPG